MKKEVYRSGRQRLTRLEQGAPRVTPQGKKTEARTARLKAILKRCGGPRTFTQLQKDLDLSPSEFTRLVAALGERSYEVYIANLEGREGKRCSL